MTWTKVINFLGDNVLTQNASNPTTTLPTDTYNMMLRGADELIERAETAEKEKEIAKQRIKVLEAKEIALENKCTKFESEKIENKILIQLIDDDLQSSKKILQCVCALAGAILGGGLILVFPSAGATIALSGTGSMAAGAAIVGGATAGCLVAPVVHEKTHKAIIQQVQNFKAKEEVSKKVE